MHLGVYFTFAPEDKAYAEQLRDRLIDDGVLKYDSMANINKDRNWSYSCFFPSGNKVLNHVHISTAGCLVVICSGNTQNNADIPGEVSLAKGLGVPVFPVVVSEFADKTSLLNLLNLDSFVQGKSIDERFGVLVHNLVPPAIEYKNVYTSRDYSGKKLVLLVDDATGVRRITAMMTMAHFKEDINFILAINGYEGLEVLDHIKPDLVILDIMMPGLDGIETLRRIMANPDTQNLDVIMYSALSGPEETKTIEMGAKAYVRKPNLEKLYAEMEKVLYK